MDQATQTPPSPPPPPPEDDIEPFTRMVRFANMFRTPDGGLPSSSGSFEGARVPKKGWEYVKCPMYPCLLFCAKEKALVYTREVYRQPHADVRNMWSCLLCFCRQPATLQQSHSQDNPRRLFLTCSKKECNFFRWTDKPLGQKFGTGCKTREKSHVTLYLSVMRMDIRCVGMTSQVHHQSKPE